MIGVLWQGGGGGARSRPAVCVRVLIGVAGAALCASGGKRSRLGMGNWLLGDGSGGSVFTCPGIGQRF